MSLNFTPWSALFLGLFIGFIVAWIWDYVFYGSPKKLQIEHQDALKKLEIELAESRKKKMALEDQLKLNQPSVDRLANYENLEKERSELQSKLAELQTGLTASNDSKETIAVVSNVLVEEPKESLSEVKKLKEENELLRDQLSESYMGIREPLEKINGIGLVFQRKLWEAGVTTFQHLARSTPDSIREIIKPEDWQRIEVDHWIKEADEFAQGEKR